MPSEFYALIGSEILRIVRTTIDLIKDVLLIWIKRQGSEYIRIISLLR